MNIADKKERLRDLLEKKQRKIVENRLRYYDPYEYQQAFHNDTNRYRVLMAGNQQGKTVCGGAELAYHLTGLYPDWWEGWYFDRPILAVCGGKNNEKTRDIIQRDLFGDPADDNAMGTGWVPKECIGKQVRKPGIPDAKYHVFVRHHTNGVFDGWSKVTLLAYDMGKETWMAHRADVNWLDEEPPAEILSQANRSTIATEGFIFMTFTPENGTTGVVNRVLEEWSVHKASWADVAGEAFDLDLGDEVIHFEKKKTMKGKDGHLKEDNVRDLLRGFLPHEVKMRIKGEPMLGTGLVFPYSERDFVIDPIPIPHHWKRVAAIDFGGVGADAHPTAVAWIAYDEELDTIYLIDELKMQRKEIPEIGGSILTRPQWIPMMWPHDGNKKDGQGIATKDQYASLGINMFHMHFTNPPAFGVEEGKGGINIQPGLQNMSARIMNGQFKVFSTCFNFLEEYRRYHTKDGKIIDSFDDIISATRYAVQSVRHAVVKQGKKRKLNTISGGNWMG